MIENKAKLNDVDNLEVFKNGAWHKQVCPYNNVECGLQCPKCFIEVTRTSRYVEQKEIINVKNIVTCGRTYTIK